LPIDAVDQLFECLRAYMAAQFGRNDSRIDGRSAHKTTPMPLIERNRGQNVSRFRSAIGKKWDRMMSATVSLEPITRSG